MKTNKRALAILTSAFMAITPLAATGLTAFAEDEAPVTHSLTVVDTDPIEHTYKAYQIITGTKDDDGNLSNMNWGDGVNPANLITALNSNKVALGIENDIASDATVNDVAAVLAKITDADKIQKLAKVFNESGVLNAAKANDLTKDGNNYTKTGLAEGWYLICDESEPLGTGDDNKVKVKSANLLKITDDESINTKHSLPTLEKVIVEGTDEVEANEASIGDIVTYKIKTKVPDTRGYNKFFYIVNDTLSKGLTYVETTSVVVDGHELVADEDNDKKTSVKGQYFAEVGTYNETTGTTIKYIFEDFLNYIKDTEGVEAGDDIVITYTAKLNDKAVITDAGNPNTASLTYSNDPNYDYTGDEDDNPETPPESPDEPGPNEPSGETPKDQVKTYTTAIKVKKIDNHKTKLTGAMFRITGNGVNTVVVAGDIFVEAEGGSYYKLANGSYTTTEPENADDPKYASTTIKYNKINQKTIEKGTDTSVNVEAFVDENGYVSFTGLGNGTYTIEEIVVPEGYNKADNVTITINSNPTLTKANWTVKNGDTAIEVDANDNTYGVEVVNVQFSNLPTTGGIGTKLFYIFGGILVAGSGVLLITKKRMAKDN